MMQEIERLARAGFALHWLHPRQKRPIGDDWSTRPVASVEKLRTTYRDGNNVGVRLGKWSVVGDKFLHVFDMDVRDPDLADEAFDTLQSMFPLLDFNRVPTVVSGSGGASRHLYVLTDEPFHGKKLAHSDGFTMVWSEALQKDVKKWDWELELFGTGKQVAIPPSIHPDTGKPYRWLRRFDFDDLDIGVGPFVSAESIEAVVGRREEVDPDDESMQPIGLTVDEVRGYLKRLPNEDLDYDDWLNVMASVQHEAFGRSSTERKEFYKAFREWSARSEKHDEETARYKFFSFKNRSEHRHRTMRSIVAQVRELELEDEFEDLGDDVLDDEGTQNVGETDIEFEDLGEVDDADGVPKREQKLRKEKVEAELGKKVPKRVAALNEKHAVARVSSKTVIMDFHRDKSVTYGSVDNLHSYYENDRVSTDTSTEPVTKAWMRHKGRRSYPAGIVFAPGREVEGAFNHWQGFSVEPNSRASCKRILQHIRKHICRGDEELSDYLIGWLAHMIQRPGEKPGVAVVLRGKKGTGKDTLLDYVGKLITHHHIKVQNQEQMLGKFNAHQEKCLLLHVEEGYWAGNRGADGALKFLITSNRVPIEPKGLNVFYVDSYLRLAMSSNEDWVVPASADERRYFVLDVDSSIKDNHAYFDALRAEMDGNGPAALLHFLQHYDISDFNVRDVPKTEALAQQKTLGLRNFPLWWFQMLLEGQIDLAMQDEAGDAWRHRGLRIDREEMREAYSRWLRTRRYDGEEWTSSAIGKVWKELLPSLESRQRRADGAMTRFYIIPKLNLARREFEKFIGSAIPWDEGEQFVDEDEEDDEE